MHRYESGKSCRHTRTSGLDALKSTATSGKHPEIVTQLTNSYCLVKQYPGRNVHITFNMLILIRKIIKIKNYIRNESTIALLDEKLLNTTKSIFNIQM